MSPTKLNRTDYHVAWIAPVSDIEVLPSRLMLDDEHETPDYDTAYDDNIYTFGTMMGHNVVIATCPPGLTGNVNAGRVTGAMFKTFSSIRMAVLVGIGGGIPQARQSDDPCENLQLGDVVVGWPGDGGPACIYFDSGRWLVDGHFEPLGTIDKPDRVLLNALTKLVGDHDMDRSTFQEHRERLLQSRHKRKFTFPGLVQDQLFESDYPHCGQYRDKCVSCDTAKTVHRPARTEEDANRFIFHRGRIATGNAVIQDGTRRDQIRDLCNGALCVEMEAAGVDASRSCLVIRGISDYADSHKGDTWRSYAAGNAAVFARELLSKIPPGKVLSLGSQDGPKSHFLVPFGRNEGFVGRDEILTQLLQRIPPATREQDCQRTVIDGLGGIGKTQVAIEAAYRVHDTSPDCSAFWVPAVSMAMFENAYRDIGQVLEIKGIQEDKADVKSLVKAALSRDDAGSWLLIIDNVDDSELLASDKLSSYLPFSRKGSILFTTRNHQVAARLDTRGGVFELGDMESLEASHLLHQDLQPSQIADSQSTAELVEHLAKLPLAIRQASAYMAKNPNVTASAYLGFCKSSDATLVELLSKDFDDRDRYDVIQNPVATTWLVSFEQVSRNRLAAEYLGMICFLAEKDIPVSLLPRGDELVAHEAIGILRAYAFVSQRHSTDRLDIHRLVRLVMLNWLKEQGKEEKQITMTIHRLSEVFPSPKHENRNIWAAYLPHTQAALDLKAECKDLRALGHLLYNVGRSKFLLGKYKEAEQICRQTLEVRQVLGREHPKTLRSMHSLATVLGIQGEYKESKQIYRQILEVRKRILGKEHPNTLGSMNNLAVVLRSQGEYKEAEQIHRQTLELSEKVLGQEHHQTLLSMDNLAIVLRRQGECKEAEQIHRRILDMRKRILGKEHPDTLGSMNNLAVALETQGEYKEAEQIHRQTLELSEKVLGQEHHQTLVSMDNLAIVLRRQGEYKEAEQIYRQTVALMEEVLGPKHPNTLRSMDGLAKLLRSKGEYEEA